MACQKVCKQGRDDIIVKVNLQSPIPTSFYITVTNWSENNAGMTLCIFTFTIISSLPCLHTFWHAIPTYFYIFNVFLSLVVISIRNTAFVRCREDVRFSEGPLCMGGSTVTLNHSSTSHFEGPVHYTV